MQHLDRLHEALAIGIALAEANNDPCIQILHCACSDGIDISTMKSNAEMSFNNGLTVSRSLQGLTRLYKYEAGAKMGRLRKRAVKVSMGQLTYQQAARSCFIS